MHNPPRNPLLLTNIRTGSIAVVITDLTKAVVFGSKMPDANYQVFLQPQANVSVVAYPSSLTANGFTLNLSVGVNATFSYLVVGNS